MPSLTLVQPLGPSLPKTQQAERQKLTQASCLQIVEITYTWALWALVVFLVFGQFSVSAFGTVQSIQHLVFGQDPQLGLYNIVGTNDEPFTDRAYVCAKRGRVYKPVSIRDALTRPSTLVIGSANDVVNGYRTVTRDELTIDLATNLTYYANTCNSLAANMNAVFDSCTALGYNVTKDGNLRIVDGVDSSAVKLIQNALPVLVIPYYDNSIGARFAIPGHDGSACIFYLNNVDKNDGTTVPHVRGVSRSVREQKMIELLGHPGGTWRNGWYEDLQGTKWHSDTMSTDRSTELGQQFREFDMTSNATERDCSVPTSHCGRTTYLAFWGNKLTAVDIELSATLLYVSNGSRFGIFLYNSHLQHVVQSGYDLEMFVANISLAWLLLWWMVSNIALINGRFHSGESALAFAGIGVLSCARGFHFLPIVLLPRLKTYLAVFSTIGCEFEGPQRALSQAWFVMYPSMAELTLFIYSLLNLAAKLAQRRMSDALFGPTLTFYCLLHYLRNDLAQSHWLEYDGRVTSLVSSAEFDNVSVLDFFRSDIGLRLNGNIKLMLLIKLAVLTLNLLPLLLSKPASLKDSSVSHFEKVLALRVACSGGLGTRSPQGKSTACLTGYELLRLGYLVCGDAYLITVTDWIAMLILQPGRYVGSLHSMRIMVFAIAKDGDESERFCVEERPLLCTLSDRRLYKHSIWRISGRTVK